MRYLINMFHPLPCSLLLFHALGALAQDDAKAPMSVETALTRVEFAKDVEPVMARDGATFAFAVVERAGGPARAGRSKLYLSQAGSGQPVLLNDGLPGGTSAFRPAFSSDGTMVAFYVESKDSGRVSVCVVHPGKKETRLLTIKMEGGGAMQPVPGAQAPVFTPDNNELLLLLEPAQTPPGPAPVLDAGSVQVYQSEPAEAPGSDTTDVGSRASFCFVNSATGTARLVAMGADGQPVAGALSPSGMRLAYITERAPGGSPGGAGSLVVCDAATGAMLCTEREIPDRLETGTAGWFRWHPTEDRLFYFSKDKLWTRQFMDEKAGAAREVGGGLGFADRRFLYFIKNGAAVVMAVTQEAPRPGKAPGAPVFLTVPLDTYFITALPAPADTLPGSLAHDGLGNLYQSAPGLIHGTARDLATGSCFFFTMDLSTGVMERVAVPGAPPVFSATPAFVMNRGGAKAPVFLYEDPATPAELYQFSNGFKVKTALTRIDPALYDIPAGTVTAFSASVFAGDGGVRRVAATLQLPAGRAAGSPCPVIVAAPAERGEYGGHRFGGGMVAGIPAAFFVTRGFAVMHPGFPEGSTWIEMTPDDLARTLEPQLLQAIGRGEVDPARIGVVGAGSGADMTCALFMKVPAIGAAVALCPTAALKIPSAVAARGALTILHGAADPSAPAASGFYNSLKKQQKEAALVLFPGAGGDWERWTDDGRKDVVERTLQFLDRQLRGTIGAQGK